MEKKNQQDLTHLNISEAKKYIEEGQFSAGSMLPKVLGCISFVKNHPKRKALITSLQGLNQALSGKLGTIITDH